MSLSERESRRKIYLVPTAANPPCLVPLLPSHGGTGNTSKRRLGQLLGQKSRLLIEHRQHSLQPPSLQRNTHPGFVATSKEVQSRKLSVSSDGATCSNSRLRGPPVLIRSTTTPGTLTRSTCRVPGHQGALGQAAFQQENTCTRQVGGLSLSTCLVPWSRETEAPRSSR